MDKRTIIYTRTNRTEPEPLAADLRRIVEDRGDVATFVDNSSVQAKGKFKAWHSLIASLDQIKRIVLTNIGDLPGRTVKDLLKILATLAAHDVSVAVPSLGIDTSASAGDVLALISAFRTAKLSASIKAGQKQSRKRIGRPPIPSCVRRQIMAELGQNGCSIRGVARKYKVSPASVIAVRKAMAAKPDQQAA